jgi:glycosyltransferase involved in cell wall biosynthesis
MNQQNKSNIGKNSYNFDNNNNFIFHDWRRNINFTISNISKMENSTFSDSYQNATEKIENTEIQRKLGIAFIYSSMLSNGISRFLQLTGNALVETGRYDVYFITGKNYSKDLKFHKDIKRFIGEKNHTIIRNISRQYKIDFFILNNVLGKSIINFYRSLGAKVIGIFHGNYMSAMYIDSIHIYRYKKLFDYYDAFVFIGSDDYYFYNKLHFQNHIFIPNLYTFEPSKVPSSNLTTHNLIILGRLNDKVKGAIYAIKAMSLIVKEVPDASLYFISSDSRIQYLKDLIKELNLQKFVKIIGLIDNISEYFLNSSVHLYPSISEAFPMAMNEGKAHGLPIVAFDVPISNPYQEGVINVEPLNYVALAKESIKLLKDFNYRKRMGEISKMSLNMFKNNETVQYWEKMFDSLMYDKDNKTKFRELQREIQNKYYNEESAIKHIEKHFNDAKRYNSNLSCFTLENFTNPNFTINIQKCDSLNTTSNSR